MGTTILALWRSSRRVVQQDVIPVQSTSKEISVNICHNCKHCEKSSEARVWYNYFCKLHKRPEVVDHITGEKGYLTVDDLGRRHTSDEPLAYCRDINLNGNCVEYEPC